MRFSDKCLAPPSPQIKKKTKLKDEQNEGHKIKTKQKENRKKKLYCKVSEFLGFKFAYYYESSSMSYFTFCVLQ